MASKLAAAGRAIGGVLGAPAGGFIEAATTPVIRSAEDSGRHLIADVDHAIASNLDRVGALAQDSVAQVDHSLAARILQIQTTADHTIDHAMDRADLVIGRLESEAQKVLDRAEQAGHALIKQLDGAVAKNLTHVDEILATHINDLQLAVSSSIQEADDAARRRLEQADEIAGRRIGNLDVIVSSQEPARFKGFEHRVAPFETAYVDFLVAAHGGESSGRLLELATAAATGASTMGLYRDTPDGRVREASRILDILGAHGAQAPSKLVATIDQNYQVRRLRLL